MSTPTQPPNRAGGRTHPACPPVRPHASHTDTQPGRHKARKKNTQPERRPETADKKGGAGGAKSKKKRGRRRRRPRETRHATQTRAHDAQAGKTHALSEALTRRREGDGPQCSRASGAPLVHWCGGWLHHKVNYSPVARFPWRKQRRASFKPLILTSGHLLGTSTARDHPPPLSARDGVRIKLLY